MLLWSYSSIWFTLGPVPLTPPLLYQEPVLQRLRMAYDPPRPLCCPLALFTVALPLANPTPLPRTVLERNIGAFLLTLTN